MAKYLLIQNFEGGAGCDTPMGDWDPAVGRACGGNRGPL